MIIQIRHKETNYSCDLSAPLDISIPVGQVSCFHVSPWEKKPVEAGNFVGAVSAGAPVNFFNIRLNPHGHGTHTESLGHLTTQQEPIHDCLRQFHFPARLVSVALALNPEGDQVVEEEALQRQCPEELPEALVIRTLPNSAEKLTADYSGKNPPYLSKGAMEFIVRKKVQHLLLDLPSVDREDDGGLLQNHRIFWNLPSTRAEPSSRRDHTITELIYVPDDLEDGLYLLNLQIPSLDLDAAPSKPVLYRLVSPNPQTSI